MVDAGAFEADDHVSNRAFRAGFDVGFRHPARRSQRTGHPPQGSDEMREPENCGWPHYTACQHERGKTPEQRRLEKTAPKMLECLKELIAVDEMPYSSYEKYERDEAAWDLAREVVAEVEGSDE